MEPGLFWFDGVNGGESLKTLIFWRFEKKYIPSQQTNEIK
jgi:hypothetical protein